MNKSLPFILLICISAISVKAFEELHKTNRQRLMNQVTDGVILIPSTKDLNNWGSDKNFLYLAGFNASGCILALIPNGDKNVILFINDNAKRSIPKDCSLETQPLSKLADFLKNWTKIYLPINRINEINDLLGSINIFKDIENISNITPTIYNQRLGKSEEEVELIENAIKITGTALTEAFKQCKTGSTELDIFALTEYQAAKKQVKTSFSQTASGPNSTNVHFGHSERAMKSKETIVFDLGVYYKNYTSDISRTFPVDGKFTKEQKQIYSVVLKAQKVGISLMNPNASYDNAEKKVTDELIKGLFELGLMTDSTSMWQKEFYIQHGFSHGIGLDVHDIYSYFKNQPNKKFIMGMVYTMEPGLYFPEDMIKSIPERLKGKVTEEEFNLFTQKIGANYKKYINIGVRIEDDILITKEGNRNLSIVIPKEIEDIEKIIQ
ncbi:MAG: M24 family metallopeptidase [Bacteroidales bacterium]|nr:MAG: M24 family metallopeptidase [Bacteroidales bacterium]